MLLPAAIEKLAEPIVTLLVFLRLAALGDYESDDLHHARARSPGRDSAA